MSVIFSEADKYFDPNKLSGQAKMVYEASQRAADPRYQIDTGLKRILGDDNDERAKYKIEVIFPPTRKTSNVTACAVTLFKSGGKIHGGGDEMLYLCRSEKDATVGCGHVLKGDLFMATDPNGSMSSVYKCTGCGKYVNRELCASTILYKLPVRKIAENIYKYFRQLDSNADIYLKYMREDIRAATRAAIEDHKGSRLHDVPMKMEYAIYTLKNILKDTSNSSAVIKKIEAFLKV